MPTGSAFPFKRGPARRRAPPRASVRLHRADGHCIPVQEGTIAPTGIAFPFGEGSFFPTLIILRAGKAPSLPRSLSFASDKLRRCPDPFLPRRASSVVAPIPLFPSGKPRCCPDPFLARREGSVVAPIPFLRVGKAPSPRRSHGCAWYGADRSYLARSVQDE